MNANYLNQFAQFIEKHDAQNTELVTQIGDLMVQLISDELEIMNHIGANEYKNSRAWYHQPDSTNMNWMKSLGQSLINAAGNRQLRVSIMADMCARDAAQAVAA